MTSEVDLGVYFTKCHAEHLRYVVAQDAQTEEHRFALMQAADQVAGSSVAISGWHNSRCLGACGVIDIYPGRAFGWAILSKYAAPHLRRITKHVNFVLDTHPARRIEMTVPADFVQGHRWARLLGFTLETPVPMRAYTFDGKDAMQYARVKD